MRLGRIRDKEVAVGTALQLAYEYDNIGSEHVSDMFNTFAECGEEDPCDYDDLASLAFHAARLRSEGKDWDAAETELNKLC